MKRVAVFGLGRFGISIARHLAANDVEVLAIDRNRKLVEEVADQVALAISCDATDRVALTAYDLGKMDAVVVAIGTNFESSVLATMQCSEMGVTHIVAKALNERQAKVLTEVGADRIVMPEEEMGLRLAEHLLHESVVDFVELPMGFSLRRLTVPEPWANRSLADLQLLAQHRLNLVQIVRRTVPTAADARQGGRRSSAAEELEKLPLPSGETVLRAGDLMDVIGADEVLDRLASGRLPTP